MLTTALSWLSLHQTWRVWRQWKHLEAERLARRVSHERTT